MGCCYFGQTNSPTPLWSKLQHPTAQCCWSIVVVRIVAAVAVFFRDRDSVDHRAQIYHFWAGAVVAAAGVEKCVSFLFAGADLGSGEEGLKVS